MGLVRVVAGTVQQPDNNTIIVTYKGGQDASWVDGLTVTVTDSTEHIQTKMIGNKTDWSFNWKIFLGIEQPQDYYKTYPPLKVGRKIIFSGNYSGKDHVVATAHWNFKSDDQIILDKTV